MSIKSQITKKEELQANVDNLTNKNEMSDFSKNINTTIIIDEKSKNEIDDVDMKKLNYEKIEHHWFFTKKFQDRTIWIPFSNKDSKNLEIYYIKNR